MTKIEWLELAKERLNSIDLESVNYSISNNVLTSIKYINEVIELIKEEENGIN